ncbi:Pet127-domain-containing protein [Obba rivulosa]|uniref:Pet127-domain-containing protein n=1 Tax=Obba rivulosa TaxID=1052685 RepID=A0A8E2DK97_9APHY|nr:Pet127-domain-containing protein [Obba rivulosa]
MQPSLVRVPSRPKVSSLSSLEYHRRIEGLIKSSDSSPQSILQDVAPVNPMPPIAKLAHGLDRVLFNPGVHWLQDPRTSYYNFTSWLQSVPSVNEFAFDRIIPFITSSRDDDLRQIARREGCLFTGSTSSLTGMLSQIYLLMSQHKSFDVTPLSQHFHNQRKAFTAGQRMPISVILRYKDGVYATDSDKSVFGADVQSSNILATMGTMLEKFLTHPEEQFRRLLLADSPVVEEERKKEPYRYSKHGKFVMRSQLDCQDDRLPGTGIFDIKTRATAPIRHHLSEHEVHTEYQIEHTHGPERSFEKEYFDLIRSAFLKYNFQARIGNMDGVLVAFHNTLRIFGFQYIPLEDMDQRLFGSQKAGDRVFEKCLKLLDVISEEIITCFPEQSVKCLWETTESCDLLRVYVEPVESNGSSKPIAQLDINLINYINGQALHGRDAVSATEDECMDCHILI